KAGHKPARASACLYESCSLLLQDFLLEENGVRYSPGNRTDNRYAAFQKCEHEACPLRQFYHLRPVPALRSGFTLQLQERASFVIEENLVSRRIGAPGFNRQASGLFLRRHGIAHLVIPASESQQRKV